MASTIKLKTGTGSAVPSALAQGEVGINIDNGLIYYGSGSGNSVKQLESFTNITSSGDISSSGTITANEYVGLPSGLLSSSADFATAAQGTKADTAVQPADTSSLLLNTTDTFTGDLTVIGDIIAERYIVSSSVTHLTQSFSSGSTIFGDTQDDTHQFTGSINVTGSVTATEYIGLPSGLLSSSADFVLSINSEFPDAEGDVSLSTANVGEHSSNLYYTDTRVKTKINTENVVSGSASNVRTFLNVEDGADVTDATNVQAAGALMDSEITNLSQVKSFDSSDYATAAQGTKADTAIQPSQTGSFSTATGVEDNADVTDTANVTSAGALMDSELTEIDTVKELTKAGISGSFNAASASFSTRVTANDAKVSYTDSSSLASRLDTIETAGYTTNTGTVDTSGTPADNQVAVFTDADTIEGSSKLLFDSSQLDIVSTNSSAQSVRIYGGQFQISAPYITPTGASTLRFGDGASGHQFDLQNNKLSFDGDSTNSYIMADTEDPENIEIHADGNIELRADDSLEIHSPISTNITASANISASGDITANSFIGDLTGNADTATTATNATNINVGNGDGSSTYFILGATSTGNQAVKRNSGFTINSSTSTLNVSNLDSAGKIFIGASDIELRGDANNFIVYNGGLQAVGNITASSGHLVATHADAGGGATTYLRTSGDAAGSTLKLEFGDLDGNGSDTKLIIDDNGSSIEITGSLDVNGDLSINGIANVSASIAAAGGGGGGTTKMYLHSNFFLSTTETGKRYVPFNNAVDQSSINNYLVQVPVMNAGSVTKISIWPQASSTSFTIGIHKNANTTAIESVTQATTAGSPITFTFSTNTFAALDEMAFSVTSNHTSNNGINMLIEFENS